MPRAPIPVSSILRSFQSQFEQSVAPLSLAEKWDNVGFLVESPRAQGISSLNVLTCIDITDDVVSEAIYKQCNMILSYHPQMFRPIQSLSIISNRPLLRCIDAGISIFVPHTALDSAQGGMNDYIADLFIEFQSARSPISIDPVSGTTVGRIVYLEKAASLGNIIQRVKEKLGLKSVRFASSLGLTDSATIESIAICVGSGSSVLIGSPAQLYLTGEMSHHDVLSCKASGKSVIMLEHSSSERPFLPELARRVSSFDHVESCLVSECDVEPVQLA